MNENPNGFVAGAIVGFTLGFFIFTALGRDIILTAGEKAALAARRKLEKIKEE